MEIEDQGDDGRDRSRGSGGGRGGSLPGITAALTRPAGAGLAHWGGPAPAARRAAVVDVADGPLPGPGALPPT